MPARGVSAVSVRMRTVWPVSGSNLAFDSALVRLCVCDRALPPARLRRAPTRRRTERHECRTPTPEEAGRSRWKRASEAIAKVIAGLAALIATVGALRVHGCVERRQ